MHLRNSLLILTTFLSLTVRAEFRALPVKPIEPADNPSTPAKRDLGKMLFFDQRLSTEGTVSCNSCHNVLSRGDGVTPAERARDPHTLWNVAFQTSHFWDGKTTTLETSAHNVVVDRVSKIPGYVSAFKKAFPKDSGISIENISRAIAVYERTLITPNSPFDKFMKGNKKVLSAQQIRGMKLTDELGCTACHSGVNFSGEENMGVGSFKSFPQVTGSKYEKMYNITQDLGRFEVTKNPEDKNIWRVPTWRNVAVTGPYFHNGSVKSLEEAVRVMGKTQLDSDLTEPQVQDIVAFLGALTGQFPKQTAPKLPQ